MLRALSNKALGDVLGRDALEHAQVEDALVPDAAEGKSYDGRWLCIIIAVSTWQI
jgi:hypothetical protein